MCIVKRLNRNEHFYGGVITVLKTQYFELIISKILTMQQYHLL